MKETLDGYTGGLRIKGRTVTNLRLMYKMQFIDTLTAKLHKIANIRTGILVVVHIVNVNVQHN